MFLKSHEGGIEMKTEDIITPAINFQNPFEGKDPRKVWADLKPLSGSTNKEDILCQLAEMRKAKNK